MSFFDTSDFAQMSDKNNQNPGVTTPVVITLDTNDAIQGISHSETVNPEEITVNKDGTYIIAVQPQVGKTSGGAANIFDTFLQKDTGGGFADVANTNIKLIIKDQDLTDVIIRVCVIDFNSGDKLRLMQRVSSSSVGLGLKATAAEVGPPTVPATPSIIVIILRIAGGN